MTAVEHGWPSHGEVVAHDASCATIAEAWADVVRSKKPEEQYYVFRACSGIRTGAELREALDVPRKPGMARLCGLAKVVSFRFRPGSIPGSGRTTTGARLLAAPAVDSPAQLIVLVAAWAGERGVYAVADSAYTG